MTETSTFSVGIDWGNGFHSVCLVDAQGKRVKQLKVLHTAQDIAKLIDWLHTLAPDDHSRVHIGIETNQGTLVEALVIHAFSVFSCNPKQTDRFRDRYCVSGAKDDSRDAFVLANAIRTDLHCFHQVHLDSPEVLELREVSREIEQTKQELGANANRLWEQIHRYYAPLLTLCPGADEPWLWELLILAPTPAKGRGLHQHTLEKLLKHHRIRRITADQLHQVLREPALPVAAGVADLAAQKVGLLIARLQLLQEQCLTLEHQQKKLLDQMEAAPAKTPPSPPAPEGKKEEGFVCGACPAHKTDAASVPPSDAMILRSLPGVGTVVSATLLSEASLALSERDLASLRGLTGVAAVTRQSGKSRQVLMRHACNIRLRNAMHHWAATSIQSDAHMRAIYDRMRGSGKNYARALRGLGEHLLRVLVSALRAGTLYDKTRWPENRTACPETAAA